MPVTKQEFGVLEYRVRAGVAGAGYPGNVNGWLPLAVAVSPAGSLNVDAVEFWDVRPMLQDRVYGPMNVQDDNAQVMLPGSFGENDTGATPSGNPELRGVIRANYKGWIAGGQIQSTDGSVDVDYIHTGTASPFVDTNHPPVIGQRLAGVFALFPFGLPRWCRYLRAPMNRVPGLFNGIPAVSARASDAQGIILGTQPVRISPFIGLGSAVDTSEGVCLVAAPVSSTANELTRFALRNRRVIWGDVPAWSQAASSATPTSHTYTLTDDLDLPRNILAFAQYDAPQYSSPRSESILVQRQAFFTDFGGFNIEDKMDMFFWSPLMNPAQFPAYAFVKVFWQVIPQRTPKLAAVVHTFVNSYTSLSPLGFIVTNPGMNLVGWEMR
jgi:hypothetical protein